MNVVKECEKCGQPKEYSKFFKDATSAFRNYKGKPDETKVSAVCRACQAKEAKINREIWKIEKGII